ncbi:MAG TPA: hypothetical protein VGB56_09470 [Flavisolibacter sp.]
MNDNNRIPGNNDADNLEDDQLRGNTMNETIREVNGDADIDINSVREQGSEGAGNTGSGMTGADLTGGSDWSPNDASAVRSGGTTDMDDQTARGAGTLAGDRAAGSNMAPKTGVTGSDFDGQNATS